jgi:hypothetical protein
MGVKAAKGMNIVKLVLLPVQTMYRRTSGLGLTCTKADPEISYPALGSVQVVGHRAEGNYIGTRTIPYDNHGSSGTVALENDSWSTP